MLNVVMGCAVVGVISAVSSSFHLLVTETPPSPLFAVMHINQKRADQGGGEGNTDSFCGAANWCQPLWGNCTGH